jgi:hypothetical protein
MKARADALRSWLLVVAAVEIRGSCKLRYKVNAQGKWMHVTEVIALEMGGTWLESQRIAAIQRWN